MPCHLLYASTRSCSTGTEEQKLLAVAATIETFMEQGTTMETFLVQGTTGAEQEEEQALLVSMLTL